MLDLKSSWPLDGSQPRTVDPYSTVLLQSAVPVHSAVLQSTAQCTLQSTAHYHSTVLSTAYRALADAITDSPHPTGYWIHLTSPHTIPPTHVQCTPSTPIDNSWPASHETIQRHERGCITSCCYCYCHNTTQLHTAPHSPLLSLLSCRPADVSASPHNYRPTSLETFTVLDCSFFLRPSNRPCPPPDPLPLRSPPTSFSTRRPPNVSKLHNTTATSTINHSTLTHHLLAHVLTPPRTRIVLCYLC